MRRWNAGKILGCVFLLAGLLILLIFLPCWVWFVLAGIVLMVLGILLFRKC